MGAARVLSGQLPTRGACRAGAISLLGSLALPWALPLASRQLSPGPSRQGAQALPHTRCPSPVPWLEPLSDSRAQRTHSQLSAAWST